MVEDVAGIQSMIENKFWENLFTIEFLKTLFFPFDLLTNSLNKQ